MGRAVTSTPRKTIARLSEEVQRFTELGFTHAKIKIGSVGLSQDQKRIETAAKQLRGGAAHLAVDAIYAYDAKTATAAASMLAPFGLGGSRGAPGAAKQGPKVAGCTRAQPMLAARISIMTVGTGAAAGRFRAWAITAFTSSIRPTTSRPGFPSSADRMLRRCARLAHSWNWSSQPGSKSG